MKLAYILGAVIVAIPASARAQVPNIPLQRFRPCLAIEDMTKERLNCYDAIVPPEPKASPPRAQVIVECRFLKEEDARVICFNRFLVERPVVGGDPPRPAAVPRPVQTHANIPLERFRACLAIENGSARLRCYDAILKSEPTAGAAPAKVIGDCRFLNPEARLTCFNDFLAHQLPSATHPTATTRYVKRGRGGCGSRGGAGYRLPNGKCASRKR